MQCHYETQFDVFLLELMHYVCSLQISQLSTGK